tara:strand:+ start:6949 stop:7188 length:240 start_codon:yes stop_codon:yes gene_type:complete
MTKTLTEDEKDLVRSSADFVLQSLPADLGAAYEIFENFAYDNCNYSQHEDECEEIFDNVAISYGLMQTVEDFVQERKQN